MIDARDGLATLISESGYYQKYIAHQVGLTEQQLTDILKKRRKLDANEMFAFCQVLGVNLRHPLVQKLYYRYKERLGISRSTPLSDSERQDFEERVIPWLKEHSHEKGTT